MKKALVILTILIITPSSIADEVVMIFPTEVLTRVIENSFNITSCKITENYTEVQYGYKFDVKFQIWNPSENPITYHFDHRGSNGFEMYIEDKVLSYFYSPNIFAYSTSMTLQPGISKFTFQHETSDTPMNSSSRLNSLVDGVWNVTLDLNPSLTPIDTLIAFPTEIVIVNGSAQEYQAFLPENWGEIDYTEEPVLHTAVTQVKIRKLLLRNSAELLFTMKGEYFSPYHDTAQGGFVSVLDWAVLLKDFNFNDYYFDSPVMMSGNIGWQKFLPGLNSWHDNRTIQGTIFFNNLNNCTLPDGEYDLFLNVEQPDENQGKSRVTINNGIISLEYITPPNWGVMLPITYSKTTDTTILDHSDMGPLSISVGFDSLIMVPVMLIFSAILTRRKTIQN